MQEDESVYKKKYSFALRPINISLFLCSGGFCVSATETTLALWARVRQPERAFYVFKKPFLFSPFGACYEEIAHEREQS